MVPGRKPFVHVEPLFVVVSHPMLSEPPSVNLLVWCTETMVEPNANAALSEVSTPGFDPSARVVLERTPAIGPSQENAVPAATVSYRSEGPERAVMTVDTPAAGVVLVRTPFDRRWGATLDGRSASILVADYFLQGIPVTAGRHTVTLSFPDAAIGYGLVGSAVALFLLLGAAAAAAWSGRRR